MNSSMKHSFGSSDRRIGWLCLGALVGLGCVGSMATDEDATVPGAAAPLPGSPARKNGAGGEGAVTPGAVGGAVGGVNPPPAVTMTNPANPATAFSCDPAALAPSQGFRRLTTAQYRNTLRDLLTFALKDTNGATSVLQTLAGALSRMPPDERQKLPQDLHGSYRRLDQDVEQGHVDGGYEVALGVGAALTSPGKMATVVGKCAVDTDASNDADCLTNFVTIFGERALRRPLDPTEVMFYKGFYLGTPGTEPAGYADVIAGLLTAPQFLYQVEHGDTAVAQKPTMFSLSGYELANRLSYHFWDSMPDADLLAAAKTGALKTPDGFSGQLARVFADPRTQGTVDEFVRDWLKLDDLKPLDARNGDPTFKTFAGLDLPKATLRTQMIDDAVGLMRYLTWDRKAPFDDVLSTSYLTAKGADLAKIYGVSPWDGVSAPPQAPGDERPGLLTRAAFLATGSAATRPVMKGVFTRESMLCDDIPPPPDNANAMPPELNAKSTTRQVVENLTESAPSCAGCHRTLINPIGFATENFDSLGRVRGEQRLFNDKGAEVAKVAIDTKTIPQIIPGDQTPSTGAADLMRLIGKSGKAHACFARNYVRYTFSRWDDPAADGCVLSRVRKAMDGPGGLQAAFREVAMASEFSQRRIVP